MEYVGLGRTGLHVSRLCLGTMNFGPHATEAESFAMMGAAVDLGINFFDTANIYGQKRGEGITEQIIGRWLAEDSGRRERIVLATKVYGSMGDGPNDSRLSAYQIRRACEASLTRLQTDHIDLYQMHHIDRTTPWEEIWQAMEQLVREGKVLYVGSSNFAAWHITRANAVAEARHLLGIVSEQSFYNLYSRTIELEVVPACEALGVGILPWSPLSGGLLGGVLQKLNEGRRVASARIRRLVDERRPQLEQWEGFCAELGHAPADVALAWLLRRPGITAPIVGPRTMEQLQAGPQAFEVTLDDDAMARLDEIWPGPGGAAPEAYAW